MCNECISDDKIETKTTYTVEYNNCIIIVKNVPCMECQRCGEITFSDEVSAKPEVLVDDFKKIMPEVLVIDYFKAP